jgi:hypothetical protein
MDFMHDTLADGKVLRVLTVVDTGINAGALVYWFRNGDSPSALLNLRDSASDRVVRCENAHPALIERDLWDSAQTRIRAASPRRTDEMLLADLRAARARWRPGKRPPKEVITAPDLRCGYGKPDNKVDPEKMKPGMRIRGRVETGRVADALVVPSDAVVPTEEGPFVWVPNGRGVRRVRVTVGRRNDEWVEVLSGLATGDSVLRVAPSSPNGTSS